MVEEGTQHRPHIFDLPKSKAIAVSLGTPIYNELPISISSAHSLIYINKSGTMPLEATPQGLVAQSQNPLLSFPSTTTFPSVILIAPCRWSSPSVVLKRRIRVNAISPGPIDTPMTSGMDPKRNQASS